MENGYFKNGKSEGLFLDVSTTLSPSRAMPMVTL